MECAAYRSLIQEELDGTITQDDARALERHLRDCRSCRAERDALVAIDGALSRELPVPAPHWLEQSVLSEVGRRATARRRVESFVITAACSAAGVAAAFGVRRAIRWEPIREWGSRLIDSVGSLSLPVDDRLVQTPQFLTTLSSDPGAQGFMLAAGVVAAVFLAVSALRFARQLRMEWS